MEESKDDLSVLRKEPFGKAISELEELMTQSGKAFLLGAGCSKCAGLPLTAELTDKSLSSGILNGKTKEILETVRNQFDGCSDANVEDFLSEIIDLLAIADRRVSRKANKKEIEVDGKGFGCDQLREAADQIKKAVVETIDQQVDISTHWNFIRAIHRPLRPGKSINGKPVDYLVLNYDTLIEDGLSLEKLYYADGMGGGTTAWWDYETFNKNELAARVVKLHGSINWCEFPDDPLPRRVSSKVRFPVNGDRRVLIWPASTKYRETQIDPFAQLNSLTRQILRPPSGSQTVLSVCGYRFGDSHINSELDRALRDSEGRLTIVAFTGNEKPEGQLKNWNEDSVLKDQVRIYAKNGFFHGDISEISEIDLPWWKFENITRLLRGER